MGGGGWKGGERGQREEGRDEKECMQALQEEGEIGAEKGRKDLIRTCV